MKRPLATLLENCDEEFQKKIKTENLFNNNSTTTGDIMEEFDHQQEQGVNNGGSNGGGCGSGSGSSSGKV